MQEKKMKRNVLVDIIVHIEHFRAAREVQIHRRIPCRAGSERKRINPAECKVMCVHLNPFHSGLQNRTSSHDFYAWSDEPERTLMATNGDKLQSGFLISFYQPGCNLRSSGVPRASWLRGAVDQNSCCADG